MASKKVSQEDLSSALTGAEQVRIVQSGQTVRTTTQAIADLSGGGPGGADMQLQFNDTNTFGGSPGFTYDKTTYSAALGDPTVTPLANVKFSFGSFEFNPSVPDVSSAAAYIYAYSKPSGNTNTLGAMYGIGIECFHDNENAICEDLYGFSVQVANETATTVTDAAGFQVFPGWNVGGGAITTLYGLKVDDQTAGVTNYSCFYGAGLYHFDGLTASTWVKADASKNVGSFVPGVLATGVGHTVDQVISYLQGIGLCVQA